MELAALVRDRVLPGNYDAMLIWWTTPPDPDQYSFYHTGEDNNHVRYSNSAVDSLLALGRASRISPDSAFGTRFGTASGSALPTDVRRT